MRFLYERGKLYNEVYHDQPIKPRYGYPIPEQIKAVRDIQKQDIRLGITRNQSFVKAARLMAEYEDDFRYDKKVSRHKPAYDSFSDIELRGYFGWRTGYKKGEDTPGGSFAEVYMYELLSGIGTANTMDGYEKLRELQRRHGSEIPTIEKMIIDYVIYNELPQELIKNSDLFRDDRNIMALMGMSDDQQCIIRFQTILEVAKWPERALLDDRDELAVVMCRCFDKVQAYSKEKRKKSFLEELCGKPSRWPYLLFNGAVVDIEPKGEEFIYDLNPVRSFHGGTNWSVKRMSFSDKSVELMRSFIRAVYASFSGADQSVNISVWMKKLIDEECQAYFTEKKLLEERRVRIDFSRLDAIRESSAVIRDKLIVEDELEGEVNSEVKAGHEIEISGICEINENDGSDDKPNPDDLKIETYTEPVENNDPTDTLQLTDLEKRVISTVLDGGELGFVREEGHMLSVVVDGINEKLYDYFGDNVLYDDGELQIYEDYMDELRELIN